MDKCCKAASLYIASLKGMSLIHQHNHWTVKGESFYGNHLLFERIYKSALENLDLAAEKFIGIFGLECLDYNLQTDFLNKVLEKYRDLDGSPVEMSLKIEEEFIKYSKYAYDCFEEEDKLTLGLDDMIMSIASDREESVYLLKQSLNKEMVSEDLSEDMDEEDMSEEDMSEEDMSEEDMMEEGMSEEDMMDEDMMDEDMEEEFPEEFDKRKTEDLAMLDAQAGLNHPMYQKFMRRG